MQNMGYEANGGSRGSSPLKTNGKREKSDLPRVKVVVVGDGGTGKTSLLVVFTDGEFPEVRNEVRLMAVCHMLHLVIMLDCWYIDFVILVTECELDVGVRISILKLIARNGQVLKKAEAQECTAQSIAFIVDLPTYYVEKDIFRHLNS